MKKTEALKEVFNKSPLSVTMRYNKHKFNKNELSDKVANNILKKAGYKKLQEEIWERIKPLEKSKFKRIK